jgi:hypothetical protein
MIQALEGENAILKNRDLMGATDPKKAAAGTIRADFADSQHMTVQDATYTTCRRLPGPDWLPDWVLKAGSISIDNEEDIGIAQSAYLQFKGVPLLPVPPISFPLSDKRKSGLLAPTIGLGNANGFEVAVPYYWNIAPNRDLTLTPTLMTARGVNLGAELRFGCQLDAMLLPAAWLDRPWPRASEMAPISSPASAGSTRMSGVSAPRLSARATAASGSRTSPGPSGAIRRSAAVRPRMVASSAVAFSGVWGIPSRVSSVPSGS